MFKNITHHLLVLVAVSFAYTTAAWLLNDFQLREVVPAVYFTMAGHLLTYYDKEPRDGG